MQNIIMKNSVFSRDSNAKYKSSTNDEFKYNLVENISANFSDFLGGYYQESAIKKVSDSYSLNDSVNEQHNISIKVNTFLKKQASGYKLNFDIKKYEDSSYYTVIITNEDMSFNELFDLALNLNYESVNMDLGFSVIAGV